MLDRDEDDDLDSTRDREITLGTSTVLGIFFGLAILCAAFLGFGYSLGSKHSTGGATASAEPCSTSFSTFKPAPGSPLTAAQPVRPLVEPVTPTVAKPVAAADDAETEPVVRIPKTPPPAPAPVVAAPPAVAVAGGTPLVVQIAAVSHQEDADLIASTLQRRGYTVAIRQEPQDKLLHVQVGPFANRKDAEAMRQKLLADGFNAYIK